WADLPRLRRWHTTIDRWHRARGTVHPCGHWQPQQSLAMRWPIDWCYLGQPCFALSPITILDGDFDFFQFFNGINEVIGKTGESFFPLLGCSALGYTHRAGISKFFVVKGEVEYLVALKFSVGHSIFFRPGFTEPFWCMSLIGFGTIHANEFGIMGK